MRKKMADRKGFTLSEVVVALAILSILSSIAYPSMAGWAQRLEFKSEVSTLVGWLHKAKMEAIKTNSIVVVEAVPDGYAIFVDNSKVPGQAGDWSRQPDEKQLVDYRIKNGITLASNFTNDKTQFSGKPCGKAGRFTLTDAKGNQMDVIISLTGRIRVE
jgi:prepilin-type N-terminal cleavage/methylation domain-containing protein